jgi:hypothetical protein
MLRLRRGAPVTVRAYDPASLELSFGGVRVSGERIRPRFTRAQALAWLHRAPLLEETVLTGLVTPADRAAWDRFCFFLSVPPRARRLTRRRQKAAAARARHEALRALRRLRDRNDWCTAVVRLFGLAR